MQQSCKMSLLTACMTWIGLPKGKCMENGDAASDFTFLVPTCAGLLSLESACSDIALSSTVLTLSCLGCMCLS